jgi:hypothetical protein
MIDACQHETLMLTFDAYQHQTLMLTFDATTLMPIRELK